MQISSKDYYHIIQYYETDSMKIAHHANYVKWMEEARLSFFKEIGFDWKKMEKDTGIMIPVLFQSVEYNKMLRFDDNVLIRCKCEKFNGVKMNFTYEFFLDGGNQLNAKGVTKHGFIDKNYYPICLKEAYPEGYRCFVQ